MSLEFTCDTGGMASAALPDVLVLAGGGVRGEAWMSAVLGGYEAGSGVDLREVPCFVGTSAGSIVAARLAVGRRPRTAARGADGGSGERATTAAGMSAGAGLVGGAAGGLPALLASALPAVAPAGAAVRALALGRVPPGTRRLDDLHARFAASGVAFDGRLRIACVDRASGRRVVFGAPGAPEASVADAVVASCAIPGVFAPVKISGREYVDGGAWSLTNLDAAPAERGDRVLCLNPTGASQPAVRAWSRGRAALEAEGLRRRGAEVTHVAPDPASAAAMGPDLMADGEEPAVMAAGRAQGEALAEHAAAA